MTTEYDTFRALVNPHWKDAAFVANLYTKARIYNGHHQYKTLCNNYGLSIEQVLQYKRIQYETRF